MEQFTSKEHVNAELQRRKDEQVEKDRIYSEQQAEELQLQAKAKKKKLIKFIKIFAPVCVLIIIAWFATTNLVMPAITYNRAVANVEVGNYEAAIAIFDILGDYKDSLEKKKLSQEALYRKTLY